MYKILRNKRLNPNDFKMDNPCDFCNNFCSQVICIPNTEHAIKAESLNGDLFEIREKQICDTCLTRMIEALNKNMVDNFQKDFELRQDISKLCNGDD